MEKKLYSDIEKIQTILWENDDMIFQEGVVRLKKYFNFFAPKAKKQYPGLVSKIQDLIENATADDHVGQDELFEIQGLVGLLAFKIAAKERRQNDLEKAFPWIYSSTPRKSDQKEKYSDMGGAIVSGNGSGVKRKSVKPEELDEPAKKLYEKWPEKFDALRCGERILKEDWDKIMNEIKEIEKFKKEEGE